MKHSWENDRSSSGSTTKSCRFCGRRAVLNSTTFRATSILDEECPARTTPDVMGTQDKQRP